jgi:hypothetical protein
MRISSILWVEWGQSSIAEPATDLNLPGLMQSIAKEKGNRKCQTLQPPPA